MKKNKLFALLSLAFVLSPLASFVFSQSISEKKALLRQYDSDFDLETSALLQEVNKEIQENQELLKELHLEARELLEYGASESLFEELLRKIRNVRQSIADIQEEWRSSMAEKDKEESYSIFNQPETSLGQLIMDYGSSEYVYVIPPEISSLKIGISSNLPIPRESWENMLSLILESNGIGVKQRNTFLRELYFLQYNNSGVQYITNKRQELEYYPQNARICFVLSSQNIDTRDTLDLLEKFSNPEYTSFHPMGKNILILSKVEPLLELLKVYDFMEENQQEKEFRVMPLSKISASEMENVLLSIFFGEKEAIDPDQKVSASLRMMALKSQVNSLFLTGPKDDVQKAIEIIQSLEEQLVSAKEKTVYWYTCSHSSAEDLAQILSKVYPLMTEQSAKLSEEQLIEVASQNPDSKDISKGSNKQFGNFIVDAKTGSILMVVEKDLIPKLQDLLKKLDVPKKMVRIEALLVEKKVKDSNHLGLNLLKMGAQASSDHSSSLTWNDTSNNQNGILSFLLSRKKTQTGIPSYDLAYQFLLSHEDIQVNASPSITTVNQTPAKIEIVEEISINTGTNVLKDDSASSVLQDSFTRAEYGIVIEITPNIHLKNPESDDENDFVTLKTDIHFDSTSTSTVSRPDVTKRHIKNEVRIADGQTVIIGGLRRKDVNDSGTKVPFLGELPGVGKLFGRTDMSDSKTEMFIFLTPKIISDPSEEFERLKYEELKKRPGDLPEIIQAIEAAKDNERNRLMQGTFTMLFGRPTSKAASSGEYDGR